VPEPSGQRVKSHLPHFGTRIVRDSPFIATPSDQSPRFRSVNRYPLRYPEEPSLEQARAAKNQRLLNANDVG